MPMPSAPQALPKAMSKRSRPEPSSDCAAMSFPPASSVTTVSGRKPASRPSLRASVTMALAWFNARLVCRRMVGLLSLLPVSGCYPAPAPAAMPVAPLARYPVASTAGLRRLREALMPDTPNWHIVGDWFDNCSCAVACPCTFAQAPDNGFCESVLFWHVTRGHYGDTVLDDLAFVRVGRWDGDLWAGKVKGQAGVFIDDRADDAQAEALTAIIGGRAGGFPGKVAALFTEGRQAAPGSNGRQFPSRSLPTSRAGVSISQARSRPGRTRSPGRPAIPANIRGSPTRRARKPDPDLSSSPGARRPSARSMPSASSSPGTSTPPSTSRSTGPGRKAYGRPGQSRTAAPASSRTAP